MERRFRLHRAEDFERLRRTNRTQQHLMMMVSYVPNGLNYNRYGFITSKRLGKAIKRNRVRRLLREAIRLLHPKMQPGFDVIVIARHPLIGQPFTVVQNTVEMLLRRAGIIESIAP